MIPLKNNKKYIPTVCFILVIIVGISIMLYPLLISHLNSQKESSVIANYSNKVEELNSTNYDYLLKKAHDYNETLNNEVITDAFTKDIEKSSKEYNNLLNINDDGVIGYIKIPKIDVNIPIYHGTSTKVLEKGIGHFEGSSLPIGGKNTHSILSGHRGLPSSRLFSDLNQLIVGDMFYIYVLDQVLAYKVDKISVVEPSNIENLKIEDNQDYITLVTCTPYGINTQRLLIRGTRTTEQIHDIENIFNKNYRNNILIIITLFLIVIIIISTVVMKIHQRSKRQRRKFARHELIKKEGAKTSDKKETDFF